MNCEEFLRQFREALEGKVSESVISENMNYYRNYINHEVNGGKSEEEVLRELGDPRLLAKTIEESSRFTKGMGERQESYKSAEYNYNGNDAHGKVTTVPMWLVVLLGLIVVVFIVVVALQIFAFFLPLILAGLVAVIVYRLVKAILN